MLALAYLIAAAPIIIAVYAYVGYPAILWTLTRFTARTSPTASDLEWPFVTITVPVYNAVAIIRQTLDCLIALDYPRERLQVLVISDASDDGTDEAVGEYADRGVELIRMPVRRGKTIAENAAAWIARGDIIVNVDASILIPPQSLRPLVSAFRDPSVGVASGFDLSVAAATIEKTTAEAGYVNYEMWIRSLETRLGSIVGASGCFYGIRKQVHAESLPSGLSWDFASVLVAREQGFRSVSVPDAVCIVPRAPQIRAELRRKVRTMARGISTLFYCRKLMNPLRYGGFAMMLISHKLLRWLPYLVFPLAFLALGILSLSDANVRVLFILVATGLAVGALAIRSRLTELPKPVTWAAFIVAAATAGFLAWFEAIRQSEMATWEPTRRSDARVSAPPVS